MVSEFRQVLQLAKRRANAPVSSPSRIISLVFKKYLTGNIDANDIDRYYGAKRDLYTIAASETQNYDYKEYFQLKADNAARESEKYSAEALSAYINGPGD